MSNDGKFVPKIVGMICNWCCYGGADLCGVSRFQYPPYIRLIRIMCSGRVDMKHILEAFLHGADAMFIGGCHPGDCHYITHGNYDAMIMINLCRRLLAHIGINPKRLRLEWVSAGEGIRFAHFMNEFAAEVDEFGPLGQSEEVESDELQAGLRAAHRLVPYIRLVERERLRMPVRSEEACERFLNSEEYERLFNELILDKLTMSRITALLAASPLSTGQIADSLGLQPSEVARHMNNSSRHGLVRYDVDQQRFSLA